MKCEKCLKFSSKDELEKIGSTNPHYLCDCCKKLWSEYVRTHREEFDSIRPLPLPKWHKAWEVIFSKFLMSGKEVVQFT